MKKLIVLTMLSVFSASSANAELSGTKTTGGITPPPVPTPVQPDRLPPDPAHVPPPAPPTEGAPRIPAPSPATPPKPGNT
jgi:hypothetical protein